MSIVMEDDVATSVAPTAVQRPDAAFAPEAILRTIEPERQVPNIAQAPKVPLRSVRASRSSSGSSRSGSGSSSSSYRSRSRRSHRSRSTFSNSADARAHYDSTAMRLKETTTLLITLAETLMVRMGVRDAEGLGETFYADFAAGHYDEIFMHIAVSLGKTAFTMDVIMALIATGHRHIQQRRRLEREAQQGKRYHDELAALLRAPPDPPAPYEPEHPDPAPSEPAVSADQDDEIDEEQQNESASEVEPAPTTASAPSRFNLGTDEVQLSA